MSNVNRISLNLASMDRFTSKLESVGRQFPKETERAVKLLGNRYRRSVREKTPVQEGKPVTSKSLIRSYTVSRPYRNGGIVYVEFRSRSRYYNVQEEGFKVRTTKRQIAGVEMVKETSDDFEKIILVEADKILKKLLKKVK